MPSFSTVAANIKAHHESLNTAYSNYYSPRSSMPSSPNASRKSSTTSMDSQHGERNITKAWKAIKKHHQEMNEAYAVFYSPGSSPASSRAVSTNPTPRASFEEERVKLDEGKQRNYQKIWGAVKKRAVEHHRSVNAATAAMYGA